MSSRPRAVSESGDRVLDEAGLAVAAPGAAWARVREARSWDLTARQLCDLELVLNGAFAPLAGFMSAAEYEGVLRAMRLPSGALWPIPVTLDVSEAFAAALGPGETIALRDGEGVPVAVMEVGETWRPEKVEEARAVYGTVDDAHPGVSYLLHRTHPVYASGRVFGLGPVPHYDHRALRHSPAALRERFRELGWRRVVAFQTRNPLHRAHVELAREAMRACEANLLLHPVVGQTAPGDIDRYTRVRCYRRVLGRFPHGTVILSLLNLAMRMAGPREALWHAIMRRNHGCTHFIVGRDHAAPGAGRDGRAFYGPYDAQALMAEHEDELGIAMVPFHEIVYAQNAKRTLPAHRVADGDRALSLSGAELRRRLAMGLELPDWFTFPEVAQELRRAFPPRRRQGFAVLFTGLSGAGKSTLANAFAAMLAGAAPVFEDAPFPIRRQAQADLAVACFGLARGGARRDSPRPQAAHRAAHRSCPGCGKAAKPAARGRCDPRLAGGRFPLCFEALDRSLRQGTAAGTGRAARRNWATPYAEYFCAQGLENTHLEILGPPPTIARRRSASSRVVSSPDARNEQRSQGPRVRRSGEALRIGTRTV